MRPTCGLSFVVAKPPLQGLLVTQVAEGGPSARGGLKRGDVIGEVNFFPMRDKQDFLEVGIAGVRPGDRITLGVARHDGGRVKRLTLAMTMGARGYSADEIMVNAILGKSGVTVWGLGGER